MTVVDYSGVRHDGSWLGKAGWTLLSAGVGLALCAAAYIAVIVVIVLMYAWTMGHFGS
jgi:hypothetical protein